MAQPSGTSGAAADLEMRQAGGAIAGKSLRDVEVPAAVETVARGRPVSAVWENELGGLTFRVGADWAAAS